MQCHEARSNTEMSSKWLLRGLKIAQDNVAPEDNIPVLQNQDVPG